MSAPGCWATAPLLALAGAELEAAKVEPDEPEEDDWEEVGVVLEPLEPPELEPVDVADAEEPVDAAEPLVVIEPVGEAAPFEAIILAAPT